MEKINIGFIGVGEIAQWVHFSSLLKMEDVNLVAICDLNVKRLKEATEKFKVKKTFTNYKQMLRKVKLDAVYIAVPPKALKPIVLYCLSQKLHVFMEKPPGVSLKETEEMAKVAKENNCKTMVGFNRRFAPVTRKAKKVIKEKGSITQCMVEYHKYHLDDSPYYGENSWLLVDIIHSVDTLRWIAGEVKSVQSIVSKFDSNYENSFLALLEFKSGAKGILNSNYLSGARINKIEIHGQGIAAYIEPPNLATIYERNRTYINPKPAILLEGSRLAESKEIYRTYGYFAENRHFIDCIKKDILPETSLEDATKTMRLMEAIQGVVLPYK